MIGRTGIHRLLTASTSYEKDGMIKESGFPVVVLTNDNSRNFNGKGRFFVVQIDDSPHNFNIENLVNAPQVQNILIPK